jgi:hypothetical protein
MALVDPEELAEKDIARVYVAGRLPEAKRVERTLSEAGVDYAVDAEPFVTNLLGFLRTQYEGVAFYVPSGQASMCRGLLQNAGLTVGLLDDD